MKKIWKTARILMILSLVINGILAGRALSYNWSQSEDFSYKYDTGLTMQYRDHVPMEEMNLEVYLKYFTKTEVEYEKMTFSLPCDVAYYKVEDGKKIEVKTLAKGTEVHAQIRREDFDEMLQNGYGVWSFPTYESEWRYAQAFSPVTESAETADQTYYYVKTEKLKQVAQAMLESEGPYRQAMKQQGLSESKAVNHMILSIDREFYTTGIWCSPNLMKPVWTWWNAGIGLGTVVTALLFIQGLSREKSKEIASYILKTLLKRLGILVVILLITGVILYFIMSDIANVIAIEIALLLIGLVGIALHTSFNQSTNVLPPKGPIEGRTFFGK